MKSPLKLLSSFHPSLISLKWSTSLLLHGPEPSVSCCMLCRKATAEQETDKLAPKLYCRILIPCWCDVWNSWTFVIVFLQGVLSKSNKRHSNSHHSQSHTKLIKEIISIHAATDRANTFQYVCCRIFLQQPFGCVVHVGHFSIPKCWF